MFCADDEIAAEEKAASVPSCVTEAAERAKAEAEQAAADRRAHPRLSGESLNAVGRMKYGPSVHIVDLSPGGALIETEHPLPPGTRQVLEIAGPEKSVVVPMGILRSRIAAIRAGAAIYRAACRFKKPIDLASVGASGAPATAERSTGKAVVDIAAGRRETSTPPETRPQAPGSVAAANDPFPAPTPVSAGWQKIVARFTDGTLMKGYTQDFVVTRPQFSLWPSVNATPADRLLVPLANLKAVFFVRDFQGNPEYSERKTFFGRTPGRRIHVTFTDGEVLVGTTLGYRAGGTGFFITPADPRANNVRVFVVSGAVRQVRFP